MWKDLFIKDIIQLFPPNYENPLYGVGPPFFSLFFVKLSIGRLGDVANENPGLFVFDFILPLRLLAIESPYIFYSNLAVLFEL